MNKSLWLTLSLILASIDQALKVLFVHAFPSYVVHNPGSAFGAPIPQFILVLVSFVFLFFCLFLQGDEGHDFIWALIFAGAFSNLIDRLNYGYVVDYVDYHIWPVFNLADVYLTTGAILILFFYLFKKQK